MKRRQSAYQAAVCLFWVGRVNISGAQAGFKVRNRYLLVKCGESRRKCRRRVTLNQDDVWPFISKQLGDALQTANCYVLQCLHRFHDLKVMIGVDAEVLVDLL
jgi:hypothetical protein